MLKGKILLDYTNLFSSNGYVKKKKKNDNIILKYFHQICFLTFLQLDGHYFISSENKVLYTQ